MLDNISLGTLPTINETGAEGIFDLIAFLQNIDSDAAGRYVDHRLMDNPDVFTDILAYPEDYRRGLVDLIDSVLPDLYRFGRGKDCIKGSNTEQYGVWPVEGYFAAVDGLTGVMTHHNAPRRYVSADVVVDAGRNIYVRSCDDTYLLAAAEVIDELTFFGFRGSLQLCREKDGPIIFQADLGRLAENKEPVCPAAG